jgi:SAM-dependent methyltransferase
MTLSELVTLKQLYLERFKIDDICQPIAEIISQIDGIKQLVNIDDLEQYEYISRVVERFISIQENVKNAIGDLDFFLGKIDVDVETITKPIVAQNLELEINYGSVNDIMERRTLKVADEFRSEAEQRLKKYTDWKFPALEIGCRDGEWTKLLVAADPLYIMDRHPEFLNVTNNQFAPEYQRRLRKYQLLEHDLSPLPRSQCGLVFSWGYFNFISQETFRRYLRQVFYILRPGGVFMFTYNNCEIPQAAGLAERFVQSYVPKKFILGMAEILGFEIVDSVDYPGHVSWIELRRPGELSTVKRHQAMGEILNR